MPRSEDLELDGKRLRRFHLHASSDPVAGQAIGYDLSMSWPPSYSKRRTTCCPDPTQGKVDARLLLHWSGSFPLSCLELAVSWTSCSCLIHLAESGRTPGSKVSSERPMYI